MRPLRSGASREESQKIGGKPFLFRSVGADKLTGSIIDYSFGFQGGGIPAHGPLPLGQNPNPQGSPEYSTSQSDEDEEESLTGEDDTGGDGSDMDMTEDDEVEGDVGEGNANGYEADHSELGSSQSPYQPQQPSPYQGVDLSSTSNRSSPSTPSFTAIAQIADVNPPTNRSTSLGSSIDSDVSLDSEEGERFGDVAEAPEVEGLLNALSDLALAPLTGEGPNPSLPPGPVTTSGDDAQEPPNTSTESETLLEMMQQRFNKPGGLGYSQVMAPASYEGMGFLEAEQR